MKRINLLLLLAVFVSTTFSIGPLLNGQEAVGSVTGVVRDPSGAAVANAPLVAREKSTGIETEGTSDSRGIYTFGQLAPGEYTVTATVTGFKTAQYSSVRVISAQVVSLDIHLEIGTVSETTAVVAQTETVDVTRTDSGTTRTLQEVGEIPLFGNGVGRQSLDFLRSLPGVNYGISGDLGGASDLSQGAVFGVGQATSMSPQTYNVDGVSAAADLSATTRENVGIMPDTISEFRLATNVNAEYGADLGNVISLVTKSGTNQFHGTTSAYFGNELLNGDFWLQDERFPYKENEGSATLGGPIIKDKTFFFAAIDLYRYAVPEGSEPGGTQSIGTVPTALMRTGNFTEWLGPQTGTDALGRPIYQGEIYDPATTRSDGAGGFIRDPFDYNGTLNVIDPTRFSAISSFFQATYPLPNAPGLAQNFVNGPGHSPPTFGRNTNRVDLKIDHFVGKTKLSVGANILFKYDQFGACLNQFVNNPADFISCVAYTPSNKKYRVSLSRNISPTIVLNLMIAYNNNVQVSSTAGPGATAGAASGLQGLLSPTVPSVNLANFTPTGDNVDYAKTITSGIPISGNLAWVKGEHELKFGVDFFRNVNVGTNGGVSFSNTSGSWNFATGETGLPNQPQTGNSWASFLLGDVDSATMNGPSVTRYTSSQTGFFAQDQWRVTSRLTLNYGLRWDLGLAPKEDHEIMASFDPTVINTAAGGLPGGVTFYGSGQGENGKSRIENTYYGAWGPRIGVAYQLLPNTVVRGYYGVVYTPVAADPVPATYGTFQALTLASLNGGITPALNWQNGFPDNLLPPNVTDPTIENNTAITYINPKANRAARAQNIGFGLEHQVGRDFLLRAEYVGKITHGILFPVNIDQLPLQDVSLGNTLLADINSPQAIAAGITSPYPGFSGPVSQALLPYPQYTSITYANNRAGFSNYEGMLLTAQKHFGAGFSFLAGYTLSKLTGSITPQATAQGLANSVFWGNLGIDRRQNFTLSWVYELPFGPAKRFLNSDAPFSKYVIGGWEISAVQNYESGAPIQIYGNESIPGIGPVWVDRVPGVSAKTNISCGQYNPFANESLLNRAAFTDPAPFSFGTTTLAGVTDCAPKTEQFSLRKNLPLGERFKMQLGANAYNAFNRHVPYYWPFMVLDIDSPDFGKTTVGSSPRVIQVFAKVSF